VKPRLPKCEVCGSRLCHVVEAGRGWHIWLCGSCEYRREHPDAPRPALLPWERRARPLQEERLF
jgi:hypothetical protein